MAGGGGGGEGWHIVHARHLQRSQKDAPASWHQLRHASKLKSNWYMLEHAAGGMDGGEGRSG